MSQKFPSLIFNVHTAASGESGVVRTLLEHSYKHFDSTCIYDQEQGIRHHSNQVIEKLSDLHVILLNLNRTDIAFNFIGEMLNFDEECATEIMALRALLNVHGTIYITRMINDKPVTREVLVKPNVNVVGKFDKFTEPDDALRHFHYHRAYTRMGYIDILEKNQTATWGFGYPEAVYINTPTQVILLDDASSTEVTMWLQKIRSIYRNAVIRTQVGGGVIDFMRFTAEEDTYLRHAKGHEMISGGMISMSNSKLVKEGFVVFDPTFVDEDGDCGGYRLTEKGKAYRSRYTLRKSVQEGLAIDDVVINIEDNSLHQVMSFDMQTGLYSLCGMDMSATQIDIKNNLNFYHADRLEKLHYLEKMS